MARTNFPRSRICYAAVLCAASLGLTACGGGGGSPGANTSEKTTAVIEGKVIDGYIEGAEVCLDVNANRVCDSNEPKATSGADGSYTLDVTSLTAEQIKNAYLLTHVPTTAKDSDDGGLTLAQVGKSAFSLMAPMAAFVNADGSRNNTVISPFTTLVSHDMMSDGRALAVSDKLTAAEKIVRKRLGLPESMDLKQDFIANNAQDLVEKARMLAVAIGEVKAQALARDGTTETQAFVAALQYLQTELDKLQAAFTTAKNNAVANSKLSDVVKAALADPTAKPDWDKILKDVTDQTDKITESSALQSSRLQGSAQKGPFEEGAMVTIYALDERAQRTGEFTRGQVDAFGHFIVEKLPEGTAWGEVRVEGRSFNEVTGRFDLLNGMRLTMIAPVEAGRIRGNVNLLTPFVMRRVQNFLQNNTVANIALAREQARLEMSRQFWTRHHVEELDVLHADANQARAGDDQNLLWFSAAFLDSGLTGGDYEGMLNDFARDGEINEQEHVTNLHKIQTTASQTLYNTARENLLQKFNSAPPAITQQGALFEMTNVCAFNGEQACVGTNSYSLPANSGTGEKFTFSPPASGSYFFSLTSRFDDLRNSIEVRGSGGWPAGWRGASPLRWSADRLIEGGRYFISLSPNFLNVSNDYVLTITHTPSNSGHGILYPIRPEVLLPDVKQKTLLGGHDRNGNIISQYAYYTFATSKNPKARHYLIFDNLRIAKMRLEVFDATGVPHGQLGDNLIFNQVYPSSRHELRIPLPTVPERVYSLRMTVTPVEGEELPPVSAPQLMGLQLVSE